MFNNSKRRGFTIIELLVVIAIITILAVALLVAYPPIICHSREGVAITAINSTMKTSLTNFYADYQCYPNDTADFSSASLVSALKGDDTAVPPKADYYPFKQSEIGPGGVWMSPLGFPYYYRNNKAKNYNSKKLPPADVHNSHDFDLWSADCKTMRDNLTDPMAIAQKTKVNNWQ